jgi:hypothetical protein
MATCRRARRSKAHLMRRFYFVGHPDRPLERGGKWLRLTLGGRINALNSTEGTPADGTTADPEVRFEVGFATGFKDSQHHAQLIISSANLFSSLARPKLLPSPR